MYVLKTQKHVFLGCELTEEISSVKIPRMCLKLKVD